MRGEIARDADLLEQHEVGSGGKDIVDHAIEREAVGHLEALALDVYKRQK